jgi:hypothetical protein
VPGRSVCHIHGGKSLSGIASPTFIHGRYSASLPARLSAQYQESQRDPRLLELRDDISLLDARLGDLLKRVDTGESGALWGKLLTAKAELASVGGTSTEATLKRQAIMGYILDLIAKGHADHQAWRELGAVIEQRRKLVESERKRLVESQQMITTERAMLLLGAVVGVIKEHISDRATLAAISTGIDNLLIIDPA